MEKRNSEIRTPIIKAEFEGEEFTITVRNKKGILATIKHKIDETSSDISWEYILNQVEEKASQLKIKTLQWRKNDIIFVLPESYEKMQNEYLRSCREIKIIFITGKDIITEKSKQTELMEKAHINAKTNEHHGRNKTIDRLMSDYAWPNIRYIASQYVKSCEQCKNNKNKNPLNKMRKK